MQADIKKGQENLSFFIHRLQLVSVLAFPGFDLLFSLIFSDAVALLDFTGNLVTFTFNHIQIIVG